MSALKADLNVNKKYVNSVLINPQMQMIHPQTDAIKIVYNLVTLKLTLNEPH